MDNPNITIKDGKRIRYWVNDQGIQEIDQTHWVWEHSYEEPIFDKFEDATTFAIESLSARLRELEKRGAK